MWLLKLHLAISVLCLLTFIGFRTVYKETIIKNGYTLSGKKRFIHWIFIIPILNVLTVITIILMITVTKEELEKRSGEKID